MSKNLANSLINLDAMATQRRVVRAAFRMSGGKTRCIPHLMPLLECIPHSRWVDHCGGTGVVSWNKMPVKKMIYNDAHSAVCDFYIALRDHREALEEFLSMFHPKAVQLWNDARDTWNTEHDIVRRAGKWYYMAVNSVSGKRGHYGRDTIQSHNYLKYSMSTWNTLEPIIRKFDIENYNVFRGLTVFDSKETLHYIDPPYIGTDQKTFEEQWDWAKMKRLLDQIFELEGAVALSHTPDKHISAYPWDEKNYWNVHLSVSGSRTESKECLYVKKSR